jgi:hypothetical protein
MLPLLVGGADDSFNAPIVLLSRFDAAPHDQLPKVSDPPLAPFEKGAWGGVAGRECGCP